MYQNVEELTVSTYAAIATQKLDPHMSGGRGAVVPETDRHYAVRAAWILPVLVSQWRHASMAMNASYTYTHT